MTIIRAGSGDRTAAKALQNRLDRGGCFQFHPHDAVAVERGDRIVQDLTGDEWVVTDVRSDVIGREVAWKAAFVTRPGSPVRQPAVVQNLNLEGATIGGLAVGGHTATAWANSAVAAHGTEIAQVLDQLRSAISEGTSLSEDAKHDLQIDVQNIANELSKRRPWAEVVLECIGHLAYVSSLAVLANRLGGILAQMGLS